MATAEKPIKIVVTGGNGFLGQHVVRLLQEKSSLNISEIIVFDLLPFKQSLDYNTRFKCSSFEGNITKLTDVDRCLKNVDAVIHCCSLISVGIFPDNERLQSINVHGTRNVLDACISNNVASLVYTSTEDVVAGPTYFTDGDETLPYPSDFTYGEYARTKCEAEQMVLKADKTILENGKELRTTSIRPDTFYGELDKLFVTTSIETARSSFGYLPRLGKGIQPSSYVGNTAWGHIKALETLQRNPDNAGGEAFFIVDDTPRMQMMDTVRPFLESKGYKLTPFIIPFWITFSLVLLFQIVANILKPICKLNFVLNYKMVRSLYSTHWFSYAKAAKKLEYKPLYSYEEAVARSKTYYDKI